MLAEESLRKLRSLVRKSLHERSEARPRFETLGAIAFEPGLSNPQTDPREECNIPEILNESSGGKKLSSAGARVDSISDRFREARIPYAEPFIRHQQSLLELRRRLGIRIVISPAEIDLIRLFEVDYNYSPPDQMAFLAIPATQYPTTTADAEGFSDVIQLRKWHRQSLDCALQFYLRGEIGGTSSDFDVANPQTPKIDLLAFPPYPPRSPRASGRISVRREPEVDAAFAQLRPFWEEISHLSLDSAQLYLAAKKTKSEYSLPIAGVSVQRSVVWMVGAPFLVLACFINSLYAQRWSERVSNQSIAPWYVIFDDGVAKLIELVSVSLPTTALLASAYYSQSSLHRALLVILSAGVSWASWRIHCDLRNVRRIYRETVA